MAALSILKSDNCIMEKFEKVKELISSIEKDALAFYEKGNNNVNNMIM